MAVIGAIRGSFAERGRIGGEQTVIVPAGFGQDLPWAGVRQRAFEAL